VRKAFDGAYGAYVVTNFWAQRTPEQEPRPHPRADGNSTRPATASPAPPMTTELRHVVWSTLEDTRHHFQRLGIEVPDALGSYKVPHFDGKGEANGFFTPHWGRRPPSCRPPCTTRAFLQGQGPHPNDNGELVLSLPMAGKQACASSPVRTSARPHSGVFRRGGQFIDKTVSIAGTIATGEELAAMFTAALGEKVIYRPLTTDQMRASGQPGALEAANMFQFYSDAVGIFHRSARTSTWCEGSNPELQNPGLLADPAQDRDSA